MLSLKVKDLRNRKIFRLLENSKIVNKFLFIHILNKNMIFIRTLEFFSKKRLKANRLSKTKITRRCIFNNRGNSALRPFGISRVYLRELIQFGLVPGYSKAVW